MIHLFINALAASAGGGLTYVRNVVPQLANRSDIRATVLTTESLTAEFDSYSNVAFLQQSAPSAVLARFWFEQLTIPALIQNCGANVLISAGNFALWNSQIPQILLSRNSLYMSRDFLSDLRSRNEYRLWIDTQLKAAFAKWSIERADAVVAPSQAFAQELHDWTGKEIIAIHHGFDRQAFVRDESALPAAVRANLATNSDALHLLFVSHYNYYRNFETLIRALPLIKEAMQPRNVRLLLTCNLIPGAKPGGYRTDSAVGLLRDLSLRDEVVELGPVPYSLLHQVYRSADVYVSPAYAESFAHPLVEAMSTGLPVIASDIGVHREICGGAALYFERFSPRELADRVTQVARSRQLSRDMAQAGTKRSAEFSWSTHVERMLQLAKSITVQSGELITPGGAN